MTRMAAKGVTDGKQTDGQPRRLRLVLLYGAMIVGAISLFLLISACGEGVVAPGTAVSDTARAAVPSGPPRVLARVVLALLAVLVTGRLLGLCFRYLGQPPVIGEVVGGIVLGPSVLGRLWPEA